MIEKFAKETKKKRKKYKKFLKKFNKVFVPDIEKFTEVAEEVAWQKIDCLDCGNCCKKMTPTFTATDITRISKHLGMTSAAFKTKWLEKEDEDGDMVNKTMPCQFLNLEDNKCSIYEVRPADCAGFPHFDKKDFGDYNHVYRQNLKFCPATFEFVKHIKSNILKEYEV